MRSCSTSTDHTHRQSNLQAQVPNPGAQWSVESIENAPSAEQVRSELLFDPPDGRLPQRPLSSKSHKLLSDHTHA